MKKDFSRVMPSLEPLKSHLLQVAVYGAEAQKCVIVLESDPPGFLDSLDELRNYCDKNRLPFPLIIDRRFVSSSLDSYPLEFLDIVSGDYKNLFCSEDLLQNLVFSKADLRLQMEREIKGKWLLTRLSVLEQSPKPKALAETLQRSIFSILPVMKGICYFADRPIPLETDKLLDQVSEITGVNLSLIKRWLSLEKADRLTIQSYLDILQGLMLYIETLDQ